MLKVTTESGSEYLYDTENNRVKRNGEYSPDIDYRQVPDDLWQGVESGTLAPVPGHPWLVLLDNGLFRLTTAVVEVSTV